MAQTKFLAFFDEISRFLKLYEAAGGHISDFRHVDSDVAAEIVATVKHSKRILREHHEPMPTIEDLNLGVRLLRALEKNQITTAEQLLGTTERQLRGMPWIGEGRVIEIVEALRRQRLQLKPFQAEEEEACDPEKLVERLLLTA